MDTWYYMHNNDRVGPISEAEIKTLVRDKRISPDSLVWNKEQGGRWKPLRETFLYEGPPPLPDELPYDDEANLIRRIADYERISGILWIAVGVIQILLVFTIIAGVWNVFAGISRLNLVTKIKNRERIVIERFEALSGLVIIGVINLIFGGILSVTIVGFDFFIRDKVLTNSRLFKKT